MMATAQGFIQPIAQSTQAVSPNNGNPNTVYNRAAPAAPVQGWASNPITPAANYQGIDVNNVMAQSNAAIAQNGWAAPAPSSTTQGQGVMQLPTGWAEAIYGFVPKAETPTPTTPTPTTPTPTIDSSTKWVIVDGKGVPGMNTDLYQNDAAYKQAYDETLAIHQKRYGKGYTNKSNVSVLTSDLQRAYDRIKSANAAAANPSPTTPTNSGSDVGTGGGWATGGGVSTGGGNINLGSVVSHIESSGGVPATKGWNSGGGDVETNLSTAVSNTLGKLNSSSTASNILQALDVLTEPFLPGNMYMSELGSVNMPNVLTSVLNSVVPGLGNLGKWLASKIPQDSTGLLGKIRDFFQKGEFQNAANQIYKDYDMEKAQEYAISGSGGDGGGGGLSQGGLSGINNGNGFTDYGEKFTNGGHGMTGTVTVGTGGRK